MRRSGSRARAQGAAHQWIRNNALGLVAIFIALSGTAVATQVADHQGGGVKLVAQPAAKKGKRGPPGPAGPQGPQGPVGPSTGAAGGDLTGSYPNPLIGNGRVSADKFAVLPAVRATTPASPIVGQCTIRQVISTNTDTPVVFIDEAFDTDGMHTTTMCDTPDPVASRLTIQRAGIYQVDAGVTWGFLEDATGERFLCIYVNSGFCEAGSRIKALGANGTEQNVSTLVSLEAGDFLQALVFQDTGHNIGIEAADHRNFLAAHWVGPAS